MNNYLLYAIINYTNFIKKKRILVLQKNFKLILSFLNILWLKGLIYGYSIKKNYITIFFKLQQNKFIFTNFLIYSKPSYKIIISAIKLKFLVQKNIQALYFLSNFTGIFTHDFAIKNNIGGILIFKIIF